MLLVFVATLMAYCQKHPPKSRRTSASEGSSPKPRPSHSATGVAGTAGVAGATGAAGAVGAAGAAVGAAGAEVEAERPPLSSSQESTLGELDAPSANLSEHSNLGSLKVVEPRHGTASSVHMSTSSVASDMSDGHMRVSQEYSASI